MSVDNSEGPKRIRLRRLGLRPILKEPKEEIIQKNLQPLLQYTEKKKRAQNAYYLNPENKLGASPLFRPSKQPVRQRLGRTIPFTGTNTSVIPPKKRVLKVNSTLNNSINNQRSGHRNYAQMRLNRIRERQRQELQLNGNPMGKRIKLRRIGTNNNMLRVEVKNNNMNVINGYNNHQHMIGRHRQILNNQVQADIREIQMMQPSEVQIMQFRFKPVTTRLTMHARFAKLT